MNQPLLSVDDLDHLYAPGKGFSDASLIYGRGKCWALSGSPGSRKTTLLKSICRAPDAAAGGVRYESRSLYAIARPTAVACCAPNGA